MVAKYDTAGAFTWVSPFYGSTSGSNPGSSGAGSVAIDNTGSIIVGGSYSGLVDLYPGKKTTWLDNRGGFITKLTSTGSLVWARSLQQTASPSYSESVTFVNSLSTDAAGNIFAGGNFINSFDFNPSSGVVSRASNGGRDLFVLSLSGSGQFSWVEAFGGAGDDYLYDLIVDSTGTMHLVGDFSGTVDFDPGTGTYNLTAAVSYNGFVVRCRRPT